MLNKKSYMNRKNILSEDIISSFIKGLFKGMSKNIFGKKEAGQAKQELQQSVDRFNAGIDKMRSATNKLRKANGKPPLKKSKKLTVKDVIRDYT